MDNSLEQRLKVIKTKVERVLQENNGLKSELARLSSEAINFRANQSDYESQIFNLKTEIQVLNQKNSVDVEAIVAENEQLKFELQNLLDEKNRIESSNDHLKLENANLKIQKDEISAEILSLRNTIEIQKNTLNELKEQNKIIKLAKEMSPDDSSNHDLKIKINELVRDIDRCIDLLNE